VSFIYYYVLLLLASIGRYIPEEGKNIKVWIEQTLIRRRRRSGIAGAGLSLYARLISHFNITGERVEG